MSQLTSGSFTRAGCVGARPWRRANVRASAFGQQLPVADTSVQQHFGFNAVEQLEKSKLGELNAPDLASLTEILKERVSAINPQLPDLPDLPQLPDFSDAVSKLGAGSSMSPAEVRAALQRPLQILQTEFATEGQLAPHWGTEAIMDVVKVVQNSVQEILHQVVNEIVAKLGS